MHGIGRVLKTTAMGNGFIFVDFRPTRETEEVLANDFEKMNDMSA